jgi:glycosyltransferase involved in cell wall biosynthesis
MLLSSVYVERKLMKVLFLGGVFPKDHEENIYKNSKGLVQIAANQFQWNLINGIESVLGKGIDIITSVFIGTYPDLYKKMYINAYRFSRNNDTVNYALGFIDIKGIEIFSRMIRLYRPVRKWLKNNKNEKCVVIVYSAQAQFLYTVKKIKKAFNNTHVCLIVPDLPENMTMNSKKTAARYIYDRYIRDYLRNIVYRNMQYVDSFVILTEYMKEPLQVNNRPYTVVEGIAGEYDAPEVIDISLKNIVYTGTLARKYGIMDLVEEFMKIPDNDFKLTICGEGDSRRDIEKLALVDERISYLGSVRHKDVLKIQAQATLLVNPRRNDEEYTRYSFPSKIMEYMLSGRPLLMYRLDGIPRDYDQFIYYFDDWNGRAMAEVMADICMYDPYILSERGKEGRAFAMKQKNPIIQADKIVSMIRGCINADRYED